jgi:hypothetical protein
MADSLFDQALASIGAAVNDVREKVVEEAWFGRAVSPHESAASYPGALPGLPAAEPTASPFEEALAIVAQGPQDPDIQAPGQDFDR